MSYASPGYENTTRRQGFVQKPPAAQTLYSIEVVRECQHEIGDSGTIFDDPAPDSPPVTSRRAEPGPPPPLLRLPRDRAVPGVLHEIAGLLYGGAKLVRPLPSPSRPALPSAPGPSGRSRPGRRRPSSWCAAGAPGCPDSSLQDRAVRPEERLRLPGLESLVDDTDQSRTCNLLPARYLGHRPWPRGTFP